jgi:hypothetical protein
MGGCKKCLEWQVEEKIGHKGLRKEGEKRRRFSKVGIKVDKD